MVEKEVENMEKQKGGNADMEEKEVRWPLRIEAKLIPAAETALAKNGIDYGHDSRIVNGNTFVIEIPIYPEDLKKYRVLYVKKEQVKIHVYWHPYMLKYCEDSKKPDIFLSEDDKCPKGYSEHFTRINVSKRYPLLGKEESNSFGIDDIERNIVEWIRENGQLPDIDAARDIVIKTLEQFEDYMEHRKEMFEEKLEQIKDKMIKSHEEWLAKQRAEEEQRKKEHEKEVAALARKPWVKALKNKIDVNQKRNDEITRFKGKFGLTDDELQTVDISDEPYVHITAKIDLDPIGIDRTVYIRNYFPNIWENVDETGREVFSDYSNKVADALAEIFKGDVVVFDNDYEDNEGYNAWLVVAMGEMSDDNIEVASRELDGED